jgi:hypothetical protein
MAWEPDELTCRSRFDDTTQIQDEQPMADLVDPREIARQDQAGDTLLLLKPFEQIQDVNGGGASHAGDGIVNNQEPRLHRHGTGDTNALALAASQLVGMKCDVTRIESHHPE